MSRSTPLWFIYSLTVTGILANSLITPALPDVLDDLGVSEERAGLVVASGSVAGIVIAPIAGLLADRWGRRIVITACLTIFGVFGGLSAAAPNLAVLLIARFFQGFGSAGLINLAVVLIGDNFEGAERTRLVGRNAAVLTITLAIVPFFAGAVTDVVNWRATFAFYLLALVTAGVGWRRISPYRPENPPTVAAQARGALRSVRSPVVRSTLVSGFVVFALIFGLFLTVLPLHLEDEFGLSAFERGLFVSLPAITASITALNLERIRTKIGVRRVLIVASILFAVAFPTIGLAPALAVLAIGAMVYGAAEGVVIPSLQEVTMSAALPEHRASTVAMWTGAARLGQTLGPIAVASALALASTGAVLTVGAVLAIAVAVITVMSPVGAGSVATASEPLETPARS